MTTTSSSGAWLQQARQQLSAAAEQPSLEAQALLAHVLSKPKSWLLAHPDYDLSPDQFERLQDLLRRRCAGEPLPYLLGHWEFYGLDFIVTPQVLIPRPETELLVEEALRWIGQNPRPLRGVDVGTGSGCIAVSLAKHSPNLHLTAVDISLPALRVARQNVARHGVSGRVSLFQSDLLAASSGPFDLVCANLPYIPSAKLAGLDVARREPALALDGGPDGLRLIERLLVESASRLSPAALLLLEIESGHGEAALELARRLYPAAISSIMNDYAGNPRLLRIDTAISAPE